MTKQKEMNVEILNKPLLKKLAEVVEAQSIDGLGFNMGYFHKPNALDYEAKRCGTVACLAGWTVALVEGVDGLSEAHQEWRCEGPSGVANRAKKHLGLTENQMINLFTGEQFKDYQELVEVTPAHAAKVVRNLIKTGEVNWKL